MYKIIKEGKAKAKVSIGKISKELDVFYNPVMEYNRTISVNLLNCLNRNMEIALPLAGSGIRGIRFFKELNKGLISNIYFNDIDKKSVQIIKHNLKLNKIKNKYIILNSDANLFLLDSKGFDYIDIDPFGTPNPFLDNTIKKLRRNGILAVTATDTAPLAGTYPNACKRKYWAIPLNNELKHEIGLRILIRKIQLIAGQYDKALLPIFSYFKDHYYRVYLINNKGKKEVDNIIKQHNYFKNSGPMWLGKLWDKELVDKMYSNNPDKFLKMIKEELDIVGFYDIHKLCQKHKLKIPKLSKLLKYGSRTIFNEFGIKTKLKEKEIIKIIKKS